MELYQQQFESIREELKELNLLLYAFVHRSKISWSDEFPTAAVSVSRNTPTFHFNPSFWSSLTIHERLFLVIHECYHVFLKHFQRFSVIDDATNAGLDVAVNHSIMRHFNFTNDHLPYLRVNGCWCDTVLDNQVLLDSLSAEEYVSVLKQHNYKYNQSDVHLSIGAADLDGLMDQLQQDIKDLFPDLADQDLKGLLDAEKNKIAGEGQGQASEGEFEQKREQPWVAFARKLKKQRMRQLRKSSWLPNKRLQHVLTDGMSLPTEWEEEIKDKVNVVLLLDTSGSCQSYRKHFLGFAKALPKDIFEVHCFGFNTKYYKIDMNKPKFISGGTSFDFFQRVFDSIPGEKIAFVFTDGEGSWCNLTDPSKWSWFMYEDCETQYIPNGCKIYNLQDFS